MTTSSTPRPPGRCEPRVPPLLATAAAWSWRLLLIAVVLYGAAWVVGRIKLVVLPCVAALLVTALLHPVAARLRRAGMPALAATWLTTLTALVVVVGVGVLVGLRASEEAPSLVDQLVRDTHQVQNWLERGPFHLKHTQLQHFVSAALNELEKQRARVAGTVVAGAGVVVEFIAGLVLAAFVTFFLVKDGERIWAWFLGMLGPDAATRADRAGRVAWRTLSDYVHGTIAVAAIHAVVIGAVLLGLGVPLVAPLTVVVFFASFIPLVGILVAGALALLVTLGSKGLLAALILLGVLVLENQVEGHLLQPLVVGRLVRLHPLAIILALTVGGVVAGIPGAIVAVPVAAVIYRVWPELRRPVIDAERAGDTEVARSTGKESARSGEERAGETSNSR